MVSGFPRRTCLLCFLRTVAELAVDKYLVNKLNMIMCKYNHICGLYTHREQQVFGQDIRKICVANSSSGGLERADDAFFAIL